MTQMFARFVPCLLFAACPAFAQTAATGTAAYIFDIKGDWSTGPQFAIKLVHGAALNKGDVVKLIGERTGSYIYIGFLDGRVDNRDCRSSPDECSEPLPIGLESGRPKTGIAVQDLFADYHDRVVKIWERLTISESPVPVFTMSRGRRLRDDPQETVLALDRGQPDMAPALAAMMPGTFDAELTPIPLTNAVRPAVHLNVRWTPPQAVTNGRSVEPGLYRLKLSAGGAESGTVIVLVAPANKASELRDDFNAAAQISRDWPEQMTVARHEFLAAVLMELVKKPADAN